ncbi:DUF881 domain-containing protein [Dehalobacter sp. DCM]|uniref:DUF881 domain-containing protein n=1 Tax=Dehalobacter sp. DCM TaxID=2907827 RepID=UPI003081EE15|nr:DUF881 domain-containing protein [Dehalobacter sp. DCM]
MQDKKKLARLLIGMGMLIIGVFFVMILKSYLADKTVSAEDDKLPSILQIETENKQLANENAKLQAELTKYQQGIDAQMLASEQLAQARISSGRVSLTGKGIVITLKDSDKKISAQEEGLIHEEHLRAIVNALWNGGAEAIAINDQRLTTFTEIYCSGSYISINDTVQMPPYTITAIGNQSNLKSALKFYGWDLLDESQKNLEIPIDPVTVPSAKPVSYRYVQPANEEG